MKTVNSGHRKASVRAPLGHLVSAMSVICLVLFAMHGSAQVVIPGPGIINTVAGNGNVGYSGDGSTATNAEFDVPEGIAVDGNSNIYIADLYDHRIRKVTASTGIISTVAGNGTAGYSGDGGAATSAEIGYAYGLAVDSSGNIYIADNSNNVIRKVTASTGIISTVAGNGTSGYSGDGGTATSAELRGPCDVAVDSSSNIYIADCGNNRIRKVTVATGDISTVAGNGTAGYSGDGGSATVAELNVPISVAVDASDNIYIADSNNNRIRKVTVTTGDISTVAGNGTFGYSGDGGTATSAELSGPQGIALDASSNIYFVDLYNCVIREVIASTGDISTVAGNYLNRGSFGGDGGPATEAGLFTPEYVALDVAGNYYISDSGNVDIRAVGASTNISGAPTFSPAGGTYTGTQTVTISGCGSKSVFYRINDAKVTIASNIYSGPITVNASQTVYAMCATLGAYQTDTQASSTGSKCYTVSGGTWGSLTCGSSGGVGTVNPTNVTWSFGSPAQETLTAPANTSSEVETLWTWLYGGNADPSAATCDMCTEQVQDIVIEPTVDNTVIANNEMDMPQYDYTHSVNRQNGLQCNQQSSGTGHGYWEVDSGNAGGWTPTAVPCNLAANTTYEIIDSVSHIIGDTGCGGQGCAYYNYLCVNGTCTMLNGAYSGTQGYHAQTGSKAWGRQDQIDLKPTGSSPVTGGRKVLSATVALGYGDESTISSAGYTIN